MMIPGIMAQRRQSGAEPGLWTPLNMSTVPQIYLDAQDSVVTDASGFASAISNLGGMGSAGDFSQSTAGNRPTILSAELNGKSVLRFDGVDDVLTCGTSQQLNLFRNVSAAWVFAVYKKRNVDASGSRGLFSTQIGGALGTRFSFMAGSSIAVNRPTLQARRLDADTLASLSVTPIVAGSYVMTLGAVSFATQAGRVYINGAVTAENLTLTTAGNTSGTAANQAPGLGAVNAAAAAPADVDLAAVVISNTYPSGSDIDKLFGWAAHKYGLTASLPSDHPYKSSPPNI